MEEEGAAATQVPLEQRLEEIVDPGGKVRQQMQALNVLLKTPLLGKYVTRKSGVTRDQFDEMVAKYEGLLANITESIRVFAPLGWGACGAMPSDAYREALITFRAGDIGAAEQQLVEGWDVESRLKRPIIQVSGMGKHDAELSQLFFRRSRLLLKAYEHHAAGAYEASIPILLAQIEGLAADVAGGKKLFFTGRPNRQAVPIDDRSLTTLSESLPVVRKVFAASVEATQESGGISRHGVLHGRELGYDTRLNSVKCFVLLQCIVEWAQPLARQLSEERRQARWAENAGSQELDERGARVDNREFPQTRDALRYLHNCQMGWRRSRGAYQEHLLELLTDDLDKRVGGPHGITMHVAGDGEWWWAWRRTVTNWCLGIGAGPDVGSEFHYDGADPPQVGPRDASESWSDDHQRSPNWKSR